VTTESIVGKIKGRWYTDYGDFGQDFLKKWGT
jgi:hypothetical protein